MKKFLILGLVLVLAAGGAYVYLKSGDQSVLTSLGAGKSDSDSTETLCEEPRDLSPAELEDRQKRREQSLPLEFLELTFESRKNLLGEWVFEGEIRNSSEFTTYKDPELQITYVAESLTELGTDHRKVFNRLEPGTTIEFKEKLKGPKKTEMTELELFSAEVEK